MNAWDVILLIALAAALALAVRSCLKTKRRTGSCCGCCEGCAGCAGCAGREKA